MSAAESLAFIEMLFTGLVTKVEVSDSATIILTFSPRRRVIIHASGDELEFAEENISVC